MKFYIKKITKEEEMKLRNMAKWESHLRGCYDFSIYDKPEGGKFVGGVGYNYHRGLGQYYLGIFEEFHADYEGRKNRAVQIGRDDNISGNEIKSGIDKDGYFLYDTEMTRVNKQAKQPRTRGVSMYEPLGKELQGRGENRITLKLDEIAQIVGVEQLSPYMHEHSAIWLGSAEGSTMHSAKQVWHAYGYRVETVDKDTEDKITAVTFIKHGEERQRKERQKAIEPYNYTVTQSFFDSGITMPPDRMEDFLFGEEIPLGEGRKVAIILDNKEYEGTLRYAPHPTAKNHHALRFNTELLKVLRQTFKEGDRILVKPIAKDRIEFIEDNTTGAWFIPCRERFWIDKAFMKMPRLEWRQNNFLIGMKEGDTIYIYRTQPFADIKYKGIVTKTKLKRVDTQIDDSEFVIEERGEECKDTDLFFEFEFCTELPKKSITQQMLKDWGFPHVQARKLPDDIAEKIEKSFYAEQLDDDFEEQDTIQDTEPATEKEIKDAPDRPLNVVNGSKGKSIGKDSRYSKAALVKANYKCQVDESHETFLTKKGKHYMEGHHLIPCTMDNAQDFKDRYGKNIDCTANIVCICPTCHRAVHFGDNATRAAKVKVLFAKQAGQLTGAGIPITEVELLELYRK